MQEKRVTVLVEEGLHARPGTQFVKLAQSFSADIFIERGGRQADAKSSVKLLLLGVKENDEILLKASGDDEGRAIEILTRFLENRAGKAEEALKDGALSEAAPLEAPKANHNAPTPEGAYRGLSVCAGVAVAPTFNAFHDEIEPERVHISRSEVEVVLRRFQKVVARIQEDFVQERARKYLKKHDQEILDALIDVATDRAFIGEIEKRIVECIDPVAATLQVGKEVAEEFAAIKDPYLSARAEDIRGLTRLIALELLGRKVSSVEDISSPAIIVAEELSAWDFAKLPLHHIRGLVFTGSAPTSHVSIMAKTHAIPTLVATDVSRNVLESAGELALDAGEGLVYVDPDARVKEDFAARLEKMQGEAKALSRYKTAEPKLKSGRAITVAANLGGINEADAALSVGAMGVGLFRTELMFMEGRKPPHEEAQYKVYAELAERFAPHQVIIRTLDVGGDKPVPGLAFPKEANPFLGWRGIRLCLDQPSVFKPQLRALLRAATHGNLAIMLPMIADVSEVRRTKEMIEACKADLDKEGVAYAMPELGIMVETPAAVFCADELASEVSFFSIGTNDLTQYVMAADRLNNKLARLGDPSHPAVMRAIEMVCEAAKRHDLWVSVCGEAASKPEIIPRLIKMGVSKLSMSPESVLRAKKTIIEGDMDG